MTDIAHLGIQVDTRTAKSGAQDLDRLAATSERTEKRVNRSTANMNRGFASTAKGARSFTQALSGLGMRNASLQLSQVAQQASATGDPIRALAIQLPDLTLGFGPAGIAAGVLAGALLPLAANLLGASDGAEITVKALSDLTDALDAYRSSVDRARASAADLGEDFGANTKAARETLEVVAALAEIDALKGLNASVSAFQNEFSTISNELLYWVERVEMGGFAGEKAAKRLKDEFGLTRDAAVQVSVAINALASASGPEEVAQKAQRLSMALEAAFGATEKIPPKLQEVARAAAEGRLSALELLHVMELTEESAANVNSEVARQARLYAETRLEAEKIKQEILEAYRAGEDLSEVDVGKGVDAAAVAAAALADRLGVSLAIAKSMVALGEGSGAPGGPDQARAGVQDRYFGLSGLRRDDIVSQFTIDPKKNSRRGGGGRSDAEKERLKVLREAQRLYDETRTELERYNQEVEELNKLHDEGAISTDTFNRAMADAKKKYEDAALSASDFSSVNEGLADGLSDIIFEGENLSDVLGNLAKSLASAALEAAALAAFNSLFSAILPGFTPTGAGSSGGGGSSGQVIAGARAKGGPVSAGKSYFVGEEGIEVFTPSTSGHITPNDALGASNVNVPISISIQNNAGAQVDVRQSPDGRNLEIMIDERVASVMAGPRGQKVMRENYGVRPSVRGA